jgi:glutamate-1-semialdehyde 2,1-aminomutase
LNFSRSRELQERLRQVIPGGSHTYAKGADQYPEAFPCVIARGNGCRVWDVDGNEFIEYGMGLRAVTLGHAYGPVVDAVRESLSIGTNFTRPAAIELECADRLLEIVGGADMVKFTKDGSSADTAALKLARAHTGRRLIAICAEQPFFSYDDWFICTTTMDGGIPHGVRSETLRFPYNDAAALHHLFRDYPKQIAAVMLEPSRSVEPKPGFLESVQKLCHEHGALLIYDELMTGFRWHLGGAQKEYGVVPDLSTFGKALANGFALSALCGKREFMQLGSRERPQDDVFLLSTTHGAETPSLAAAIATMRVYSSEPVIEHLYRQGTRLRRAIEQVTARHGLQRHFEVTGRPCSLLWGARDANGAPSQAFRTLLLQETLRRGIIIPSLVVSYSHSDSDIDQTVDAIDGALSVYGRALSDGVERHLQGRPSRIVFDRR